MRIEEQITTIELHRALFRLRHARTAGEKILLEKTVKWLRGKIEEYRSDNDRRIQRNEKTDNSGEVSTSMRLLREKNNKSK